MNNLVFVGSEAEGYYSGATECVGVFVDKEYYDQYKTVLEEVFLDRNHGELDGKHSEVYGDLIVADLCGIVDVIEFINEKGVDFAPDHFTEYIDGDEVGIDSIEPLVKHIKAMDGEISGKMSGYRTCELVLSDKEYAAVIEFIADIREERETII